MNLFYLEHNTKLSAQYHCDKHVVKMILEYAQLLSTAHRLLDGNVKIIKQNGRNMKRWILADVEFNDVLYKATHFNHPSAVWVRLSDSNYQYLYRLFCDLCDEYTFRYKKLHLTDKKLRDLLKKSPSNIPLKVFNTPPCCMPEHCIVEGDVIASYQKYYNTEKKYMTVWSKRPTPKFMSY